MTHAEDLSGRSLLAIFAHPDDESIACGGLLARCAARGARVSLICVTHGENHGGVRDEAWYERRADELRQAAEILGVGEVVLFDYPDGFLPWIEPDVLEARLAKEIRRLGPDVVVTFGEDGLYWHPDHCAVYERTTSAVAKLGREAPALYYVTMPPGMMRALVNEYRSESDAQASLLGVTDPDAFGVSATPPTLVMDVTGYAAKKLAALQCHRTQVHEGLFGRVRLEDAPRLLGIEHFRRAPGDSTADAFIERL